VNRVPSQDSGGGGEYSEQYDEGRADDSHFLPAWTRVGRAKTPTVLQVDANLTRKKIWQALFLDEEDRGLNRG
jgi:hypothetical protein